VVLPSRGSGSSGQVVPWFLLLVSAAVAATVGIARVGLVVDDSARARTAADAAALAGVHGDERTSREVAQANGAVLESFAFTGDGVEVLVRVGRMRARARAAYVVDWPISGRSP